MVRASTLEQCTAAVRGDRRQQRVNDHPLGSMLVFTWTGLIVFFQLCVCVLVMHVLGKQCETHTCVVFCTVLPLHDKVRG